MKFRMINLGYRSTPDYPYDYRIELVEYATREREQLTRWLNEQNIPHTTAGRWYTSSVIYMREREATLFALRWS